MERILIVYNTIRLLYEEGDLSKEAYLRRKKELIIKVYGYKEQSQKRILNLDSLILMLENE